MKKIKGGTQNTSINVPNALFKRIKDQVTDESDTGSSRGVSAFIVGILKDYYEQLDKDSNELIELKLKYTKDIAILRKTLILIVNGDLPIASNKGLDHILETTGLDLTGVDLDDMPLTDTAGMLEDDTMGDLKDKQSTPRSTKGVPKKGSNSK